MRARTKLAASAVAGVAAGLATGLLADVPGAPLVGWDVTGIVFLAWVWSTVWRLDAEETAAVAVREDPTRAATDLLLLCASVASLVAVGFALVRAAQSSGAEKGLLLGLGLVSVAVSWAVVHTVYTLRYARLYYTDTDGGIDFHGDEPPMYMDFAYLAFTIGMTFQVSDTDLEAREIRVEALKQSLISFVFGTGIVATAINLVANLGH